MSQEPAKRKVHVYALSTCVWCRKTKRLLDEMGVEYGKTDVDLLEGEEKNRAIEEMEKWNPAGSFPTTVIDDEVVITGFDEPRLREELGDDQE